MAGTLVANTINTDTGLFSTQNAYQGIAKAWVNFEGGLNGTSGTIYGSFNVSSVTYVSTGNYTVNFTASMPNSNYSCVATCQSYHAAFGNTSPSLRASSADIFTFYVSNLSGARTPYNVGTICVSVISS